MSAARQYHLSCHCQRNILTVEAAIPSSLPEQGHILTEAEFCNCSFCVKRLIVWHKITKDAMKVFRGCNAEDGSSQIYNMNRLQNTFCPTCGTLVFAVRTDRPDVVYLNLRAIRDNDFDFQTLPIKPYAGAELGEPYEHAESPSTAGTYFAKRESHYKHPMEIYTGSCHCKAVRFSTLTKPLHVDDLVACLCSICHGNGTMWIYPGRRDIIFEPFASTDAPWSPSPDLVTRYAFGKCENEHVFCKTCGVQVIETREGSPGPEFQGFEEDDEGHTVTLGVNLATFNGMQDRLADGRGAQLKNMVWNASAKREGGEYAVRL